MAYTAHPAVVTGQVWSAANQNTYVRDNFTALWQYTSQGDITYATNSSTLTRLAIGTASKFLKSSGTVPTWGDLVLQYCSVYSSVSQTIPVSGSWLDILWNAEYSDVGAWHSTVTNTNRITPGVAGDYMAIVALNPTPSAGEDNQFDINLRLNTTTIQTGRGMVWSGYANAAFVLSPIKTLNATDYFNVQIGHGKAGTRTLGATDMFFTVLRLS